LIAASRLWEGGVFRLSGAEGVRLAADHVVDRLVRRAADLEDDLVRITVRLGRL